MRVLLRSLAVAFVVGAIAGACAGGPTPTSVPSSGATGTIDVTLTDALRIEPVAMTVPFGRPVTFRVTNAGSTQHEFFLGSEAEQAQHAGEMAAGGMMHDDENGIGVAPGETKTLTHTFPAPGQTLGGCHVGGHYDLGMKATITITES